VDEILNGGGGVFPHHRIFPCGIHRSMQFSLFPIAAWLFGSGVIALVDLKRRGTKT
jgi:hypothetical protein